MHLELSPCWSSSGPRLQLRKPHIIRLCTFFLRIIKLVLEYHLISSVPVETLGSWYSSMPAILLGTITADLSKRLNSSHYLDGHGKCSFNLTSVTNEDKDLYPIRGHPLSTSKEYSGFWISFPFPYTHATSITRAVLYPNPLSMEILNGCPLNRAAIEEQHHNQDGSQAK